jgi:amphi-Trp domain-containing protein
MGGIEEFRHESLEDSESIAKYLEALRDALRAGKLELSDQGGELTLRPQGLLGFEIRARKKGDRVKIRIKMGWREDSPEEPLEDFHIKIK